MKKVAIISRHYFLPIPPIYGGACEELINILIEENEKDKKVELVCFQKYFNKKTMLELQKYKFQNTKMVYVKTNKLVDFFVKATNKICKKLKLKIRLVNTYDSKVLKYLKKHKVDKIIFEAGTPNNAKKYTKYYNREQIYKHLHTQEEKENISEYVGNLLGVSQFICDDYQNWLNERGVTNVKDHALLNFVKEEKFNKPFNETEKKELRSKYGYDEKDFVVLFTGRISEEKGVRELVKAIEKIKDDKVKLIIVGSPNFKDKTRSKFLSELQKYQASLGDRLVFTGYVENTELYKYYKMADLQAVPSMWEEAAGLVVAEGVLCGVPQIVTRSGGIPEYVCKEGSIILEREGMVDALAENIARLSKNKKELEKMQKANLEHAKTYKKANFFKNFVKIMEK